MSEVSDDEFLDGCDIDFKLAEQTSDEDLPMTFGGVGSEEEHLDGCDINFAAEIETLDEELPVTTGGVG
jgi:hypothetical protein